jgi:hypothetical protein
VFQGFAYQFRAILGNFGIDGNFSGAKLLLHPFAGIEQV